MKRFIAIVVSVLCVVVSTFALASPPVNTLLQFTSGGHVMGFAPNKVYIAGMGHALTEEFINPNMVTPKPLSSDKVIYENLWKGINLTYEAQKTGIAESTYTVNPGSDVNNIRIRYNADVTIQNNGTLTFNHPTSKGSYTMSAPIAWQEKEGTKIPVHVAYTKLSDTALGFTTGPYDTTLPLVIDPVYQWHTFHGSSGEDRGQGIAVDTDGNVYVTGYSDATWGIPINSYSGGRAIVVVKLDSSGAYQWHTFHGSGGWASGSAIAVDTDGNVYVTGVSTATWGTPLNPYSNGAEIVILKLNSSGVHQWHTFHGSGDWDYGYGIAVDTNGNVYVTGHSWSSWGTPINPHSRNYESGNDDIVVLKLNSSGTYQWHTFYGSGEEDQGRGITLDRTGNVYVTGHSDATWGQPLNPHSVGRAIVVVKLNSAGAYQWHTFHGSSSVWNFGYGIAVDAWGSVYVTGVSNDSWGTPINPHSGDYDIVVLKLNSSGAYQWHTFSGSSGGDYGTGIAVDTSGNIYITGSSDTTWGSPLNPYSGSGDIVVLKLNSSGVHKWHTFCGSSGEDRGQGIAVDTDGNVYVTGQSEATWGPPINPHSGDYDMVVVKMVDADNILSPTEGTTGTRITINGSGFTDKKGKVLFNGIAAKIAKGGWFDYYITCTIKNPPLPVDVAHPVSVVVNKVLRVLPDTFFTVRDPAVDPLAITSGIPGIPINVTGKFFSTKGSVYLENPGTGKRKKCKVANWGMNEVSGESTLTFVVPKLPKGFNYGIAYPLRVINKVGSGLAAFTIDAPPPPP